MELSEEREREYERNLENGYDVPDPEYENWKKRKLLNNKVDLKLDPPSSFSLDFELPPKPQSEEKLFNRPEKKRHNAKTCGICHFYKDDLDDEGHPKRHECKGKCPSWEECKRERTAYWKGI